MVRIQLIPFLLAFSLAACAGNQTASPTYADDNDPYEGFNRKMFAVNMSLDRHILKPVAKGYLTVPQPVRASVRNFRNNLISPVTLSNDTMQGSGSRAGVSASRLLINTTIGVLGLFDPATAMGLPRHTEDFGQTLAVYGVPEGAYMYVPLLGPGPPRDMVGLIVDTGLNPITHMGDNEAEGAALSFAVGGVDARANNLGVIDEIERSSVDFYASVRSLYRQNRESEIRNGETDLNELPDLDELDNY